MKAYTGVGDMWPGASPRGVGELMAIKSMARPYNPFTATVQPAMNLSGFGDLWPESTPVPVGTQIQGFGECGCAGMGAIDITNMDTLKTLAIGAAAGLAACYFFLMKKR